MKENSIEFMYTCVSIISMSVSLSLSLYFARALPHRPLSSSFLSSSVYSLFNQTSTSFLSGNETEGMLGELLRARKREQKFLVVSFIRIFLIHFGRSNFSLLLLLSSFFGAKTSELASERENEK